METSLEEGWKKGVHVGSNGKETPIADMNTAYLENTIRKYKDLGHDTSVLEAELAQR